MHQENKFDGSTSAPSIQPPPPAYAPPIPGTTMIPLPGSMPPMPMSLVSPSLNNERIENRRAALIAAGATLGGNTYGAMEVVGDNVIALAERLLAWIEAR